MIEKKIGQVANDGGARTTFVVNVGRRGSPDVIEHAIREAARRNSDSYKHLDSVVLRGEEGGGLDQRPFRSALLVRLSPEPLSEDAIKMLTTAIGASGQGRPPVLAVSE